MSRPGKALCVSAGTICPIVTQVLARGGVTPQHVTTLPEPIPDDVGLVIVDRAARVLAGDALRRSRVPVVVLGDDLEDDALIALMLDGPVSHLVEDPHDRTLGITTAKLATGDVFGLEKYVAPGSPIGERVVDGDLAKRRAMDEVTAWAEGVGARRPVVHRIASVVDELLMNALNGRDGHGRDRVTLRWAADDRTLALSVADDNGTLRQRDVIDHVRRAKGERGRPEPAGPDGSGAGLGLYLVLANVTSLVVNVALGRRTEVVCLFDVSRRSRPQPSRARSLHVFAS